MVPAVSTFMCNQRAFDHLADIIIIVMLSEKKDWTKLFTKYILIHFLSKYPVFQVLSHYCSHNWPCCSKMLKGVFAVFMKKKANDAFSHCFHIFLKRFLMICWKCGISRQILDHIPRPQTPRRNEREKLHRAVKFNLQITQFIQINPFVGEQISKQISSTAFLNKGLST